MSASNHELVGSGHGSVITPLQRAELRRVSLIYWRALAKWFLFMLVLLLASVFVNQPRDLLLHDVGFIVVILCATAAFPAGIAVATQQSAGRRSAVRALLGSSILISLFAFLLNGFAVPLALQATRPESARLRVDQVVFFDAGPATRRLDDEIWMLRSTLYNEQRRRMVEAQSRGASTQDARLAYFENRLREERVEGQIRSIRYRIQHLASRNQLVLALALLPFLGSCLGFLSGRWSSLIQLGLQRQLFNWTVGFCVAWTSSYALATGYVVRSAIPTSYGLVTAPHVVLLPSLLLLMMGVGWLLVGRRMQLVTR